ncbi:MAG: hypothetical protein NTW48_02555 [Chloroflexi bacterium]|nr:hypothetical protein [Chloroflexota bacterium]
MALVKIVTDTGSDVTPEPAQQLGTFLPKLCPRLLRIGPALGVHAGPGALLVALREG